MSVDFELLERQYFFLDKPVPYLIDTNLFIDITPISVIDSEIFLSSVEVISIDKNILPDPKIIQMSYLQFIGEVLIQNPASKQALFNICKLCLGLNSPYIFKNDFGKYFLGDTEKSLKITSKQFDEIKSIILKQNLLDYDDEYMHPDLKKALDETRALKNKNLDIPTLERKMAIITSHCGLSKSEQLKMSFRSHSLLFKEVCGEIDYTTTAPIAMFAGKSNEIEHWIFKKKKQRFDGEIISVSDFNKAGGGTGEVSSIINNSNENSPLI